MAKINSKNERIKRKYLTWLEDAQRKNVKTTNQVAAALSQFECSTGQRDFAAFHFEQARKFKRDLEKSIAEKTGKPLSDTTIRSRLLVLKAFFEWLSHQPGYKSKVDFRDAAYFSPSARQDKIATAKRETPIPTLEQIRHVVSTAPHDTALEKRDRALIAFAILTGMRDAAMASIPIGKVNLTKREVFQDARMVRTKNSKTMTTFFFPVGEDFEKIVEDWITYLRSDLLFSETDPLFPKTEIGLNKERAFTAVGLCREHWADASAIRRIFRERFEAAGLPYFHPHSFRKTLAHYAYDLNLGLRDSKAWSQNLGHEKADTTWTSYGTLPAHQTGEIMTELASTSPVNGDIVPLKVLEWLQKQVGREI